MGGQVSFVGQEISEVRPEPCIKVRGYRNGDGIADRGINMCRLKGKRKQALKY